MRLNPDFILRKIGDSVTLVPFGQALVNFNSILTFNGVGSVLAEELQEDRTLDELVEATTRAFNVDEETARRDVKTFVERLRNDKLLVDDDQK